MSGSTQRLMVLAFVIAALAAPPAVPFAAELRRIGHAQVEGVLVETGPQALARTAFTAPLAVERDGDAWRFGWGATSIEGRVSKALILRGGSFRTSPDGRIQEVGRIAFPDRVLAGRPTLGAQDAESLAALSGFYQRVRWTALLAMGLRGRRVRRGQRVETSVRVPVGARATVPVRYAYKLDKTIPCPKPASDPLCAVVSVEASYDAAPVMSAGANLDAIQIKSAVATVDYVVTISPRSRRPYALSGRERLKAELVVGKEPIEYPDLEAKIEIQLQWSAPKGE